MHSKFTTRSAAAVRAPNETVLFGLLTCRLTQELLNGSIAIINVTVLTLLHPTPLVETAALTYRERTYLEGLVEGLVDRIVQMASLDEVECLTL